MTWQVFPLLKQPHYYGMISYEDLRIQLAICNSLMELNFQVRRRPVSQPLAQTALFIGSSLLLPTSLGTNQHPRALQECQTLVTQGQRKVLPEFACDRFPSLLFWNYPKDQFSSVLEEQTFFFFHRYSINPQIHSS